MLVTADGGMSVISNLLAVPHRTDQSQLVIFPNFGVGLEKNGRPT